MSSFAIRPATESDAEFLLGAFDSVIPVLLAAGNGGQWGTQLFSSKDGFAESLRADLVQSENFRLTGKGEQLRIFIAESTSPTAQPDSIPVAFITIRERHFSQHVSSLGALKSYVDEADALPGGYVYIDVLIADQRVADGARRGAGRALVDYVWEHARGMGAREVYVDCWSGGDGKLAA